MPRMKYTLAKRIYWYLRRYPAQPVLDFLEESQWWPRERLEALRNNKLRALIEHCYAHVPYYRKVMDARRLKPGDFTSVRDLTKLPVLTKDLVRQNLSKLWADNIPAHKTHEARTGGTTGEPMRIRRWPPDVAWQTQCYARELSWGGLGVNQPRISLFGGSLGQPEPQTLRGRLAKFSKRKNLFLPAFELGPHNVADYAKKIQASPARHLLGYASAVYLLAFLTEEAGLSLHLDTVYPTAELLPDAWRNKITAVFSCKVLPYYGCGEVNSLGYQCGEGEGYHRPDEHAIMEALSEDGTTSFEGSGAFLVTDLDNHAMPILRYKNGDAGVLGDAPCPCGRTLGRILELHGRVNDMLLTTENIPISGVIATYALQRWVRGVKFFQFVQDRPGQIRVRIVPTSEYHRDVEEKRLREILRKHLGESAEITFEYPEDIERTPAGKARFVINHWLTQKTDRAAGPP